MCTAQGSDGASVLARLVLLCAGPMCEVCAPGFYLRPDRICGECPEASGSSSIAERVKGALPFTTTLLATLVIMTWILARLERMSGEDNTRKAWVEVSSPSSSSARRPIPPDLPSIFAVAHGVFEICHLL